MIRFLFALIGTISFAVAPSAKAAVYDLGAGGTFTVNGLPDYGIVLTTAGVSFSFSGGMSSGTYSENGGSSFLVSVTLGGGLSKSLRALVAKFSPCAKGISSITALWALAG
jgi:hypothetical protein